MLYELLTGALPLDFKRLAFDEILRILRDQDALRPSTKITTLGEESTTAARNRGSDPPTLVRQLRGDPDAITLKAIEKDRSRRYTSASELAADIGRYLRHEPVTAHPPSIAYRTRKYLRRNKLRVSTAAVVALAIALVLPTNHQLQLCLKSNVKLRVPIAFGLLAWDCAEIQQWTMGTMTMSQNRLQLCRKSTLLFAIVIALSFAFAQSSTTRPESVVVFAPHPDDEVIGCAGIIQQALARGARVKVVAITSGDGFPAAAAGVTHKQVDQVGPDDFFALSRLRQTESRNALEILGGKADDLIFLGYPDGDLGNLYESTDDKIVRQQFTRKNETYALIQKDYHTSVHGKPAPYNRSSVLDDLAEVLRTLEPTEIYVTDETDGHIDHRAAFWFVRDAAKQVGFQGVFHTYLVHGLPAWPFPPGVTPNQPFESRKVNGEVAPRDLPWPPPKRVPLTQEQVQLKLKSIQAHNIPVVGMPKHQDEMESFVKSEEVFWTPLAHNQ